MAALVVLTGGSHRATTPTSRHSTPTVASSTSSSTGTTVIPRSSNPVVALAQQYDGRYVGMVDLNGDLFGGGAKQIRRIDATVTLGASTPSVATRTSAFGFVTGKLGSGLSIVLSAPSVPDGRVKTFELTGTLRSRGF